MKLPTFRNYVSKVSSLSPRHDVRCHKPFRLFSNLPVIASLFCRCSRSQLLASQRWHRHNHPTPNSHRCFSTYKPYKPSEDPMCVTIPVSASLQAVEYSYWFLNFFIHMDGSERIGFALFHVRYLSPLTSQRGLRTVKRLHSRIFVLSLTKAHLSGRTMALETTQPLTEISISWIISWEVMAVCEWDWRPYHHRVSVALKLWEPVLQGALMACPDL